ncbi:MAG: T9SS type A sorting domain-containing protein [Bacteroidota bacterium]
MRHRYALVVFLLAPLAAAAQTLPAPWVSGDIGTPPGAGESAFAANVFTVTGGGDIWGGADAFHLVSRPLGIDGILTARVNAITDEPDWAKAGLVMRASAAPGAPYVGLVASNLGVHFQVRAEAEGETEGPTDVFGIATPTWLRLTREQTSVKADYSVDGVTWTRVDSVAVEALAGGLTVGLGVSAADYGDGTTVTATFAGVSLTDLDGDANAVSTETDPTAGFAVEPFAPNPASGAARAVVRTAQPGTVTVEAFDLLGRRVAARTVRVGAGTSEVALPTEAVPAGVYLVRLTEAATQASVVQRLAVVR